MQGNSLLASHNQVQWESWQKLQVTGQQAGKWLLPGEGRMYKDMHERPGMDQEWCVRVTSRVVEGVQGCMLGSFWCGSGSVQVARVYEDATYVRNGAQAANMSTKRLGKGARVGKTYPQWLVTFSAGFSIDFLRKPAGKTANGKITWSQSFATAHKCEPVAKCSECRIMGMLG